MPLAYHAASLTLLPGVNRHDPHSRQLARYPPRSRNHNNPHSRLKLLELERRDNPAIPVGLTDISALLGSLTLPTGYAETHAIVRNESTSVTVDQAGTGSAGTFTVTVDASSFSSDTAFGGAAGIPSITTTGTGTGQSTAHFVISGTYAGGAFTVTSETYSETGAYSVIQSTVTTYPNDGNSLTHRADTTRTGNHTLTWTAAIGTGGQLAYTSYDYVSTEAAHTYTKQDYSGGGFFEVTTDAAFTVHTVGSGPLATYAGTDWSTTTTRTRYPNPGGSPFESTSTSGWNNPVGGSVQLGGLSESTANWTWNAGTATATNYTFHGVAVRNDALAETATLRAEGFGSAIDVHSFSSTSHLSDTGHVVEDEPGTPTSGTELYHRDELYASAADVTGSGSYTSGYANADYHAAVTINYAVANRFDVRDQQSTGLDGDGVAYTQTDNYSSIDSGSGIRTEIDDYHDGATGLVLTGGTIGFIGASTFNTRMWGTRNGDVFDIPHTITESLNESHTQPANANSAAIAGELNAFAPMRPRQFTPNWQFCQVPLPKRPLPQQPMQNEMKGDNILNRPGQLPGNTALKPRFQVTVAIYYNKDAFTEYTLGNNNANLYPVPLDASTTGEMNRLLNRAVSAQPSTVTPKVRVELIAVKNEKELDVVKKGRVNQDPRRTSASEWFSLQCVSLLRAIGSVLDAPPGGYKPLVADRLNTTRTFNHTMNLKPGLAPAGGGAYGSGVDFGITLYRQSLQAELADRNGADAVSLTSVAIVHEMMHGFGLDHSENATQFIDSPLPSATAIFGRTILISSTGASNLFNKMQIPN